MSKILEDKDQLSDLIIEWYRSHGRAELPWRKNITPYKIWISEIMLQQTQVKTVIPYFLRFIKTYPTFNSLVLASEDQIIALWSGLGFYRRAKNIYRAKEQIKNSFNKEFPDSFDDLMSLPGIGESTAGAIMSIAYKKSYPILDANVKRVLIRYLNVTEESASKKNKILWEISRNETPTSNIFDYTQGIMDLGSIVCKPKDPLCSQCPIALICDSAFKIVTKSSKREKTKKNKPQIDINFTLAHTDNEYLLFKRNEKTFWDGLWLPSEQPKLHKILKKESSSQIHLSRIHKLTHLDLNMSITLLRYNKSFDVRSNGQYRWVNKIDINNVGMPAPIKKIILEI